MGGTPGASFAFADNIIGLTERTAIRNVVDAAYLRYDTQGVTKHGVAEHVAQGVAKHVTWGVHQDAKVTGEMEIDFKLDLSPDELRGLLSSATLDRVHAFINATACRHTNTHVSTDTNTSTNTNTNTSTNPWTGSTGTNANTNTITDTNTNTHPRPSTPPYNRIVVRRCAARGRCIPWHVDVSHWVCQVPYLTLNPNP